MNKRQKLVQKQYLNNEEAVVKQLEQAYSQASNDINDKVKKLTLEIDGLQEEYDWMDPDDPERARIKSKIQSKIYQRQYQEQLQSQVDGILKQMQTEQFTTISDYLDTCYTDGYVGTVYDQHGQGVPILTPIDQEAMVRAIQLDSKISKGLYTKMGEDVDDLKRKITAEVSRGIATGRSYSQVAKSISDQSKIGYNKAARIARTEGHRIQNTATKDAMVAAKERGADVLKQWDATLDGRTRSSHITIDGEFRELEEPFSNGLDRPGDPKGKAAEVVNCRCALLQRARWALGDGFTKFNNFTKELETFDSPEDYGEFKKTFFSAENREYMKYVQNMEDKYGTKNFPKVLESMSDEEYARYTELLRGNSLYNGNILTNAGNSDIIKSSDIVIGKSIGAKSKNYDIELPNKEIVHLTEGTRITSVEVIAGKGRNRQIDEIDLLIDAYGGSELEWQKKKGKGYVDYEGESYLAELHWYEEPTAGRHKWKVKPDADGNWFIEDEYYD